MYCMVVHYTSADSGRRKENQIWVLKGSKNEEKNALYGQGTQVIKGI